VRTTYLQICSESGENHDCELGYPGRRCKFAPPAAPNPNSRITNLKVLATCANLKAFGMSVISRQIPLSDDGADTENNVVRVLSSYYDLRPN